MRLFAFSLAAFALSSTALLGLFLYALHVPTKVAPLIEQPSALASSPQPNNWPERWAATNLRSVVE